jgi:hypothetical protein
VPTRHTLVRDGSTGQPANDFNKPKIDLGAIALGFVTRGAATCDDASDGAEVVLRHALDMVRPPART